MNRVTQRVGTRTEEAQGPTAGDCLCLRTLCKKSKGETYSDGMVVRETVGKEQRKFKKDWEIF